MKPFVFPAWIEKSPSLFYLQLGPSLASVVNEKIAYKATGMVAAELDARGPFWRASAPVRTDEGWKCRDVGGRFASADDAKRAVEQSILEAGDGRYIVPLPGNTISVAPDGTIQMQGRLLTGNGANQQQLRAAVAEVARLVNENVALATLDELVEAIRRDSRNTPLRDRSLQ